MFDCADKTPAFFRRAGKERACFINGTLSCRARNDIKKALVYWFDGEGELRVDLVPTRFIREREFKLEG